MKQQKQPHQFWDFDDVAAKSGQNEQIAQKDEGNTLEDENQPILGDIKDGKQRVVECVCVRRYC